MICPACIDPMIILEYRGTEIDFCLSCQGIWLDQGELEILLDWTDQKLDLSEISGFSKSKRRCPRCRKKMVNGKFPRTAVEVDICRRDGGIWLDRNEILRIAEERGTEDTFKKVRQFFSELFDQKPEIKEE